MKLWGNGGGWWAYLRRSLADCDNIYNKLPLRPARLELPGMGLIQPNIAFFLPGTEADFTWHGADSTKYRFLKNDRFRVILVIFLDFSCRVDTRRRPQLPQKWSDSNF